MNEDPVVHATQTVENLQPPGIKTPLRPEDFHPGESLARYYGHKADQVTRELGRMIARRRQRGHSDEEIAEDLDCTVQELQERFPQSS